MGFFGKSNRSSANEQVEQYLRTKQVIKLGLIEKLAMRYNTGIQEDIEKAVIIVQSLNYLMGDELGDTSIETPEATKVIIRRVKSEIPSYARKLMQDSTVRKLVVTVLQLQKHSYEEKMGSDFAATAQGQATYSLLSEYCPDGKEISVEEFRTLLSKIGVRL